MTLSPEFSRPIRLDQIGGQPRRIEIEADEGERAALAARFGLLSLDSLSASLSVEQGAEGILVTGRVTGRVVQPCVATAEPVPAAIDEAVSLRFLPEPESPDEEVELDAGEVDTVFYTGGAIDLGEAAAETLALALDPFPRSPHAAQALKDAGVLSEEEAGPFGALAALKDRMGKGA